MRHDSKQKCLLIRRKYSNKIDFNHSAMKCSRGFLMLLEFHAKKTFPHFSKSRKKLQNLNLFSRVLLAFIKSKVTQKLKFANEVNCF